MDSLGFSPEGVGMTVPDDQRPAFPQGDASDEYPHAGHPDANAVEAFPEDFAPQDPLSDPAEYERHE